MAFVFYWDVSVFKFFHNIKFAKDEQNVEEGSKSSEIIWESLLIFAEALA